MTAETDFHSATSFDAEVLLDLLAWLDQHGYDFVPPAPFTHANRLASPVLPAADSPIEILGWSRTFDPARVDAGLRDRLSAAGALEPVEGGQRSRLRVARVRGRLFLHSAYPTSDASSVFLGPDSYRYVDFITRNLTSCPDDGIYVDVGTGSGVAAILTALAKPGTRVVATDLNPAALDLARINALHSDTDVTFVEGRGLGGAPDRVDVVMSNPPFMIDPAARLYRDGGGMRGLRVALDIAQQAMARLMRGGRLLLFTGSPIVTAQDPFRQALASAAAAAGCELDYCELDPDVYCEELLTPAYAGVDRIALVGAIATRSG